MNQFEFISGIEDVAPWRIYAVFGFSFLYLLYTLRESKFTFFSIVLVLFSLMGVFEYADLSKYLYIALFLVASLYLLYNIDFRNVSKLSIYYVVLIATFLITYMFHGFKGLGGYFSQFTLYSFPFIFYFILRQSKHTIDYDSELSICIKLLNVQIFAAIVKLILVGFNEKLVGTMSISGGSIPTLFPAIYFAVLFIKNKGELTKKDWLMVLLSFVIAIASNKRGVWFMVPVIIIAAFFFYQKVHFNLKSMALIALIPLILYFGVRLNPTLNPEGSRWGSFNFEYLQNYLITYNLGTKGEEDITEVNVDQATGRIGGNIFYLLHILEDPLSSETLLGVGNETYNETEDRGGDLGFQSKYMLTAWVEILVRFGAIVLLVFTISIIRMIGSIRSFKPEYLLIMFIYFLYYLFYTSAIVKSTLVVGILWLLLFVVKHHL